MLHSLGLSARSEQLASALSELAAHFRLAHDRDLLLYLVLHLLYLLLFKVRLKSTEEFVLENFIRGDASFRSKAKHLGEEVTEGPIAEPRVTVLDVEAFFEGRCDCLNPTLQQLLLLYQDL